MYAYLEPLILEHAFDCRILVGWRQLSLEDNAKRSVANDLALGILQVSGLAGDAVLDLFADDFYTQIISIASSSLDQLFGSFLTPHP